MPFWRRVTNSTVPRPGCKFRTNNTTVTKGSHIRYTKKPFASSIVFLKSHVVSKGQFADLDGQRIKICVLGNFVGSILNLPPSYSQGGLWVTCECACNVKRKIPPPNYESTEPLFQFLHHIFDAQRPSRSHRRVNERDHLDFAMTTKRISHPSSCNSISLRSSFCAAVILLFRLLNLLCWLCICICIIGCLDSQAF